MAAVAEVLSGTQQYSSTVKEIIKKIHEKDLLTNATNRQIIFYLSQGYKIKDLEAVLGLSLSAIKRRIDQMCVAFDVSYETTLLREVRRQGYL